MAALTMSLCAPVGGPILPPGTALPWQFGKCCLYWDKKLETLEGFVLQHLHLHCLRLPFKDSMASLWSRMLCVLVVVSWGSRLSISLWDICALGSLLWPASTSHFLSAFYIQKIFENSLYPIIVITVLAFYHFYSFFLFELCLKKDQR